MAPSEARRFTARTRRRPEEIAGARGAPGPSQTALDARGSGAPPPAGLRRARHGSRPSRSRRARLPLPDRHRVFRAGADRDAEHEAGGTRRESGAADGARPSKGRTNSLSVRESSVEASAEAPPLCRLRMPLTSALDRWILLLLPPEGKMPGRKRTKPNACSGSDTLVGPGPIPLGHRLSVRGAGPGTARPRQRKKWPGRVARA